MHTLEQISKKYAIIQLLDKQIAAVEMLATQFANGDNIIYFTMKVEDLHRKNQQSMDSAFADLFNSPGFIDRFMRGGMYIIDDPKANKPAPPPVDRHEFKLETRTALLCLQIIVDSYRQKRAELIKEIELLMTQTSQTT